MDYSTNTDFSSRMTGMGTETTGGTDDAQMHTEGRVARAIEHQTAMLPSDLFLWAATGSIIASLTAKMMGKDDMALFVGHWAPTFLILGLYNKIVKTHGHDEVTKHHL